MRMDCCSKYNSIFHIIYGPVKMETELISKESCLLMFRGKVNTLTSQLRILK